MTKIEWLKGDDPAQMLDFLATKKGSDRKFRLVTCELLRRDESSSLVNEQRAIALAERWADGQATKDEATAFSEETLEDTTSSQWIVLIEPGIESVRCVVRHDMSGLGELVAPLLHEVFGNPFRKVKCAPSWLTSDVLLLARGIYDERAFDRMPILADALQDAGCNNDDILNHCRDTGATHIRGCWALDLVLGKL